MLNICFLKDFKASRLLRGMSYLDEEAGDEIHSIELQTKFAKGETTWVRPVANGRLLVTSGNIILDDAVEGTDYEIIATRQAPGMAKSRHSAHDECPRHPPQSYPQGSTHLRRMSQPA